MLLFASREKRHFVDSPKLPLPGDVRREEGSLFAEEGPPEGGRYRITRDVSPLPPTLLTPRSATLCCGESSTFFDARKLLMPMPFARGLVDVSPRVRVGDVSPQDSIFII
jgi:hypothetical protein